MYLYKSIGCYYLTSRFYSETKGTLFPFIDRFIGVVNSNYGLINQVLNSGGTSDELLNVMEDYRLKFSPIDGPM